MEFPGQPNGRVDDLPRSWDRWWVGAVMHKWDFLSNSYLKSVYGGTEWKSALASDPEGKDRRLLVVRVAECDRPGLLAGVVGVDLFGVTEADARDSLRQMVAAAVTGRAKPAIAPRFPGADRAIPAEPGFPGRPAKVPGPSDASPDPGLGSEPPVAEEGSATAHVRELLAEAERVARTISGFLQRSRSLRNVAEALAGYDQDEARELLADAEQTARAIGHTPNQVTEMSAVAAAMAKLDPGRSHVLLADAERQASTIATSYEHDNALDQIVRTVAEANPADAEHIARAITAPYKQGGALRQVAKALAGHDPREAERVARSIAYVRAQSSALLDIAAVQEGRDPGYSRSLLADAEQMARTLTGGNEKPHALMDVAVALAGHDPADAERVASSITDAQIRCWALCGVARAVSTQDPDRARRLLVADAWRCIEAISHLKCEAERPEA